MLLIEANWCPEAAEVIHDRKISNKRKSELKGIFLEGLINFLDIYAQTEIGGEIELDIMKIALHINSAQFENDDLYAINSIDDVYRLLETLTIMGLPVWRFLKLSEYQKQIFEFGYNELLLSAKINATYERPCYGCIWYDESNTFLGVLRKCNKPRIELEMRRKSYHDPDEINECKWLTTLESIPNAIYCDDIPEFRRSDFLRNVEPARNRFKNELLKDPFRIPKELAYNEKLELDSEIGLLDDFACAFNNLKTKSERKAELRKAMYTEGMIRFFVIYAKCEMGSRYTANIKAISMFLDRYEHENIFDSVMNFDDVYKDLENKILERFDVRKFIKFEED